MTTETKTRTITLTDRPPVRIREDQWPVVAQASGDSYRGDVGRHEQARRQGEIDTYSIRVREHDDGRAIVYAVLDAAIAAWGHPAGGESARCGELLPVESTITDYVAAIRRVGADCGLPESVIRACIADLPAEEI